jgi:hypothetical protein
LKDRFYLLAIPSENISDLLYPLRHKIRLLIGREYTSMNAPPHLSLCTFSLPGEKFGELKELLDTTLKSMLFPAFRTLGLETFFGNQTAYLSIYNIDEFNSLQGGVITALKNSFPSLKRNMSIPSTPHISIGRGFSAQEMNMIMDMENESGGQEEFTIREIRLMVLTDGKTQPVYQYSLQQKG